LNRKERRFLAKTNAASVAPARPASADLQAKLQLAFTQYSQGNLAGAETHYREILTLQPDQPDAMRLLGETLADLGRFDEAIKLLSRLISVVPGNAQAFYALGNAYRLAGRMDSAIAAYRSSLAIEPNFAGSHHGLASVYVQTEHEPEALEHLRHAARLQPGWAQAWKDLGLSFARLGELGLAEAALARAVSLQPNLADAHRHLAALRQQPASQAEQSILAARAANPGTPAAERIDLSFALGRLNEQAGNYDAAFYHFSAGNNLLSQQLGFANKRFDRQRLRSDIDQIIASFPRDGFQAPAGAGNSSEQPVFIVGMPRSGSSLFEQIAASHARVFGAGEHKGIGAIAARIGWAPTSAWTEPAITTAANGYLSSMPDKAAERIIDKMPDNIFLLGLIAALFPKARVIFCQRDPRDLAVSCFFQRFTAPLGFDTDLEDIAYRIRELKRLESHWMRVLPLRVLSFSYEQLLAAPDSESRRLIEFLGLEWDEKCLEFYRTRRVVRTASWAQVRKPLYGDSVGRWKHYERHLGPLMKALADEIALS
jgi:tetratricopeptide (TPR) repeat protein